MHDCKTSPCGEEVKDDSTVESTSRGVFPSPCGVSLLSDYRLRKLNSSSQIKDNRTGSKSQVGINSKQPYEFGESGSMSVTLPSEVGCLP